MTALTSTLDHEMTLPPTSSAARKPQSPATLAWRDLAEAVQQHRFWLTIGWNDVVQRYRGSILGPFWLTLSTAIFVVGLGPLYAMLFGLNTREYLPYLAVGIMVWSFITSIMSECCRAFIDNGPMMRQMRVPRLTLIFHVLWRNVIIFAHNAPVYVGVAIYAGIVPGLHLIELIPGFILFILNMFWIGTFLAIICARFRDFIPIVSSLLQLAFFVTPIIWNPKLQPARTEIVNWNPFNALVELLRAPLLGNNISSPLLYLSIAMLVIGFTITAAMFARHRKNIIYWV
jgi:ABC-type polysaccharide/polyol phosphate export permease